MRCSSVLIRLGGRFEEIAESTNKVNSLPAEIATASREQADGAKQVNLGVSQLDGVTQQSASNSEELASAAEETAAQAAAMRYLVGQFRIGREAEGSASTISAGTSLPKHETSQQLERAREEHRHVHKEVASAKKRQIARIPLDDDEDFDSF